MTNKFKAGDRVRINDDAIEDGWLLLGEEGTVSEFDECASYCEGHLIFRNEYGEESNYDLDEVTLVESKSAFKAGQKVRITQDTSTHRRKVGDIVTLSDEGEFNAWRIEEAHADTGYRPWVNEADMEPYTEEPVEPQVGEVRRWHFGDEFTVTEVTDTDVSYVYSDAEEWGTETYTARKADFIDQSLLVTEAPEPEDDEPFPVGTKVRVTGDTHVGYHWLPTGTVGEVVEIADYRNGEWRLVAHTEKREWGIDPARDARNVHVDDLEIVTEPEVEIVDVWGTEDLKVGDVVVREEEVVYGWGESDVPAQVERKVVKAPEPAPEPEPHRNDLPTAEGSVVKFAGWRHAVLTTVRDSLYGLQWVFVSGVPVKELFDPFTHDIEFEVKYDAGR